MDVFLSSGGLKHSDDGSQSVALWCDTVLIGLQLERGIKGR